MSDTQLKPYEGLLVVSLEQAVAAPLASCHFAQGGARVITMPSSLAAVGTGSGAAVSIQKTVVTTTSAKTVSLPYTAVPAAITVPKPTLSSSNNTTAIPIARVMPTLSAPSSLYLRPTGQQQQQQQLPTPLVMTAVPMVEQQQQQEKARTPTKRLAIAEGGVPTSPRPGILRRREAERAAAAAGGELVIGEKGLEILSIFWLPDQLSS